MDTRDELERRVSASTDRRPSGCLKAGLWLLAFFPMTYLLTSIYVGYYFELRFFGPPPTLWERVRPWLCTLGPQTIIALVLLYRHYKHKERPAGLCARCGYDLCATPGRCPECGAVPDRA